MANVPGRLIVDLQPNGTVRMVFIASVGGGNEMPIIAKNLDVAEIDFISTCGLSAERAAAFKAELKRNRMASVETSIDEATAAKFRFQK
jgi:hypothetical protein